MVGWGCRMRAFNLKAPLGLSCSCTLPETHQLLEVKYPLCLFPQHTCSWLCAPMSPSPVCSCCPNISQHPSAGVTGPGTMKCSSSLLLCSPSFASWLSWLHSSCPPFRLPTWLSFASGWWWWGGGVDEIWEVTELLNEVWLSSLAKIVTAMIIHPFPGY